MMAGTQQEQRQTVLDMVRREHPHPVAVPKSFGQAIRELESMHQLRIVAVEPFYYLCEATG